MMFLAVPGLALASFVFAFCLAGIWVSGGPSWSASLGRTMLAMLVVIIGMSLVLIEPAAISPAWLQYTLLVGVPAAAGFFRAGTSLPAGAVKGPEMTELVGACE